MAANGVVTVCNWARVNGKWMRYSLFHVEEKRNETLHTIVVVPGNPGNDKFYFEFCSAILRQMPNYQIYILSHLNHVPLPKGLAKLNDDQRNERFNLGDQIHSAYKFVEEVVASSLSERKITFIGHSIGSYISLCLRDRLENDGYEIKVVGLFPTVEHMALTPAGLRVRKYVDFFANHNLFGRIIFSGLQFIPWFLKLYLTRRFIRVPVTEWVNEAAAELVDSLVARNVMFMASNELDIVRDIPPSMLEILSRPNSYLYYGIGDKWAPKEFAEEMMKRIGKEHVVIDKTGASHAFVLESSENIAEVVISFFLKE